MGAFNKLFAKYKAKQLMGHYFAMLDGYTPVFTSHDGGVYEMELTRACIHAFANHCSKAQPKVTGPDSKGIQTILDGKLNIFHTCAQFIYKAATIYETQNTCFIAPILDKYDQIAGYYPVVPNTTELREKDGEPFLVYTFGNGQKAAIEMSRVGVVSKFLYTNDLVGEDNSALEPTLQLMSAQKQGIAEGIKNSASFRFIAQASNFAKGKDLRKDRDDWVEENMGAGSGGLALFPNTWSNIQQVQSTAKVVDPEQMKLIDGRAFNYFGCNEKILRNEATGDDWSAYYEGKIEPFLLQLAQAMTEMSYSAAEKARKNGIAWSSNRMQYMTNADKLQVSSQMFDRGILSTNDVMDIWALPHVEGGDKRYIRKEYIEVSQLDKANQPQPPDDPEPNEPKGGGKDDTKE